MAQNIEELLTPEFGNMLRAAREQKRLSISEIASRLRLNPQYIGAMERADIHALPPDPYKKAFLKEYCRALGVPMAAAQELKKPATLLSTVSSIPDVAVDVAKKITRETSDFTKEVVHTTESAVKSVGESVKDAVEEITSKDLWAEAGEVRKERLGLNVERGKQELPTGLPIRKREQLLAEPTREPQRNSIENTPLRRSYAPAQPFENVAERTYAPSGAGEEEFDDYHPGMSGTTKVIIALLIVIAGVVSYSLLSKKSGTQDVVSTEEVSEPAPKTPPQKEQPQQEPLAPASTAITPNDTASAIAASPEAPLVFTIKAKDSVWASITPDIGNGFRGKLKKGETKTFSAKENYLLFIGNLKSVEMTLDGKSIASLPTVDNSTIVVRNVILTREKAFIAKPGSKPDAVPQKENQNSVTPKNNQPTPSSLNNQRKRSPKTVQPKQLPIRRIPSAEPVLPGSR